MISRSQTLNLKPTLNLKGSPILKRTVAKALAVLKPPPDLTISDWADQNRRLSSEASAEPGQWRTSRAEYQRGIMEAVSDAATETVVIMSSSQVGKALALMIACRDRGLPQPGAVVPISPWADLTQSSAEMDDLADRDPELTKPYLDRFARAYAGDHDPRHPLISPAFADYSGIESAILLQCGSEEILLGDARAVLENARAVGVDARLEVYGRCYHGWQNAGNAIPEAADAARSIAGFVRENCTG
jgi:acetyl esterase/lipase